MRKSQFVLSLVLCGGVLCGGIGLAQTASPVPSVPVSLQADSQPSRQIPVQAEISTHDAPATFRSSVFLVQVPVVVRDKEGRAIGTLKKEDFQLFDKGKPQIISRFAVEKAGASSIPAVKGIDEAVPGRDEGEAGPIPEHFIAYLFDDLHLDSGDLARMRAAASRHIDQSPDPLTRLGIFTTSGLGQLDFTDDRDKIHDAMNRIQPNLRIQSVDDDCPHISLYMADLILNKNDPEATGVAEIEAAQCTKVGVTPPSSGPTPLGPSPSAFSEVVFASALSTLTQEEGESGRVLEALKALMLRMTGTPGSRSIVLLSPGFLLPGEDFRPAEVDLLDRAIRANTSINTLDARGVFTSIPGGEASKPNGSMASMQLEFELEDYEMRSRLEEQNILGELADGTGGNFFHNDNDLEEGLNQVTKPPDFVYILGFSPGDMKYDGSMHSLKVSLVNPAGLATQARRAYYAPKRAKDPQEAAKEEIREAVFSRDEIQDIPVDLKLQFFKSTPANARLSVISRIDVKNLRFRKDAERDKNTLTLVTGIFDRNGNLINGVEKTVDMNLRAETLAEMDGSGIALTTNFDVTPGSYTIRVVVRDAEGQQMAARNGAVFVP